MRKALIASAALVLLLAAGYAALPWLVSTLVAPRIMERAGLDALELETGYPGLSGLHIARLHLEAAPLQLQASNIELGYDFAHLREGRVTNIVAETLTVTILEAQPAPVSGAEAAVEQLAPSQPLALEALLAQVPADRLSVAQLALTVPAKDFAAQGTLALDAEGLEAQLTGMRPQIARDLNATITLRRTGIVQVSVDDPDPVAPSAIQLKAEPEGELLRLQVSFSVTGYGLELLQASSGLPAGTGAVTGTLATNLPWPLDDLPDWQTLEASAQLEVDWSLAEPAIELNGMRADLALDAGRITVTPFGAATFSNEDLNLSGTFTGGVLTYRDGTITAEEARLSVQAQTADLKAKADVRTLKLEPGAPLTAALSGTLELQRDAVLVQGLVRATLSGAGQNYEGTFDFDGHTDGRALISLPELKLEDYPLQLTGSYALADNVVTASAALTARTIANLPFELEHDLTSARGSLSFAHTQSINEPLLIKLLPGWKAPYDLDRGAVDLSGKLTWDAGLSGLIELQPRALAAHYDDYAFFDTAGKLTLSLADATVTLLPSTLTVGAVDIGVPVTDLNLTLAGSLETLAISHATASLLGGRASTEPFDYQIDPGNADFLITLTDIDLSRILALEGEKVSGTGRLSGTIPVALRNNRVHVQGGKITAGVPGLIQLSPTLTAGITQPGLDIAFKALENFNYNALNVMVDYDDEGDMLLGVRLEGRNPDLEGGRPVHFNLNISENIPVLLQSLRLQDNFTKTIERRVLR